MESADIWHWSSFGVLLAALLLEGLGAYCAQFERLRDILTATSGSKARFAGSWFWWGWLWLKRREDGNYGFRFSRVSEQFAPVARGLGRFLLGSLLVARFAGEQTLIPFLDLG